MKKRTKKLLFPSHMSKAWPHKRATRLTVITDIVPKKSIVTILVNKFGNKIALLKGKGRVDQPRLSLMISIENPEKGMASWEDEIDAELLCRITQPGASLCFTVMWPLPDDVSEV